MVQKRKPDEGAIEEEETFVRGGGSGLAPVVKKQLEQEAYAEAEADLLAGSSKKGGKRRKSDASGSAAAGVGDEEDAFFRGLALQDKLPKYVELLKFRNLSRGCKLWGAVIEVTPRELVVSLPHGLRGQVPYGEASDFLHEQSKKAALADAQADVHAAAEAGGKQSSSGKKRKAPGPGAAALPALIDLFSIGQLVRATVTAVRSGGGNEAGNDQAGAKAAGADAKDGSKKKATKRVMLSLRVSKMNGGLGPESLQGGMALPACVRSVEDHGFTLALGIKGVSGFLSKKEAAAAGRPLAPGVLLDVVVPAGGAPKPAGGGSSVVNVTCLPEAVATAVSHEWEGLNIGSLLPGQLVTARVRNVLSDGLLCSFLTYFSGTVDPFHLGTDLTADWRKQFSPNQRLRARILFVDPETKRVGLSLQRHLLADTLPPNFPMLGQVFSEAVVRRVDEGLGLLLELPAEAPATMPLTPGYAHISNLGEDKVEDIGKRFRPGQKLRARVLGFRPMDGLAVLSLKPSVVDSHILSIADIRPGMPLSATVLRVDEYWLLIAITSSIRALVPLLHASDTGSAKALRKFKEGQKVAGKVLTVDAASKKVTVTLKPSLVGSKLRTMASFKDAMVGVRSHGVVTGAEDRGVFVSFFGGLSGLAHFSECGLAEGQKPGESFKVGQVVKCRVLGADPSRKGLKLSLVAKAKAAAEPAAADAAAEGAPAAAAASALLASYQLGQLVHGIVTAVHTAKGSSGDTAPAYYELSVAPAEAASGQAGAAAPSAVGRLEVAHLADHPAAQAAMVASLAVGTQLGPLMVLQHLEKSKQLRLTRKASMLAAAEAGVLPSTLEGVAQGAVMPGYVASITNDSVFVRYLGGLTGRAGLAQLSDTFVADPHQLFREGQSVRTTVVQVDAEKQRFSVALKQSLCSSRNADYLQSLFSDLEYAESLSTDVATADWGALAIGSVVPGEVHEVKDFGLLCDLDAHDDVVGMATRHQLPEDVAYEAGTKFRAVVLDSNKAQGIVELSMQPRLLQAAAAATAAAAGEPQQQPHKKQKKQKKAAAAGSAAATAGGTADVALAEGQQVDATVELLREEGYCVTSLAASGGGASCSVPLGFLPTADFNLQHQPRRDIQVGQTLSVRVAALPSPATGGRLLLAMPQAAKPARPAAAPPAGGKGQPAQPQPPAAGSCVQATVGAVHGLHADLELEGGFRGRLYITEASSPLSDLRTGAQLPVAVLGRAPMVAGRRHALFDCSNRPDVVAAAKAGEALPKARQPSWSTLKPGESLQGFVQEVERGYVWCAFSTSIRGRAFATQASSSIDECERLTKRYQPGQAVHAVVLHVDAQRHALDVSLQPAVPGAVPTAAAGAASTDADADAAAAAAAAAAAPKAGSVVLGRITAVGGGGVRVQLSARCTGRVALTDIHDSAVQQVLAGLEEGQYCRAAVLGPDPACSQTSSSGKGSAKASGKGGGKGKGGKGGKGKGGKGGKDSSKDSGADNSSQLLLSLRPAAGGQCAAHAAAAAAEQQVAGLAPGQLQPKSLKPGQKVAGYVKSAGQAGVFVCLARNLDARIRLSQLANGFVEAPAEAFPEGRLVAGQVLSVEGDKVELTLRTRNAGPSLDSLEEGQVVRGKVKKVAAFGVFVELDGQPGGSVTGLAHLSEVADEFVSELAELFTPGQRVVARVLKVDAGAGRLSLGLKPSYFEGLSDDQGEDGGSKGGSDEDFDADLVAAAAGSDDSDDSDEGEGAKESSEGDSDVSLEASEDGEAGPEGFDLDEELAAEESASDEDSD